MKKGMVWFIVIMGMLFLSGMNVEIVWANSGPPITGLEISPTCNYDEIDETTENPSFDGNFDILVRVEDFDEDDFGEITSRYKTTYPFYEDIAYLNNIEDGWRSYSAHEVTENWGFEVYRDCGIQFGDDETVAKMKYIKIVYFSDDGNTLFLSEEIRVPGVLFYQTRDAVIDFNTDDLTYTAFLAPSFNGYILLGVIVVGGFILYSVAIELIMAFLFNLHTKKALLHILFINAITQIVMYLYFYLIFDSYRDDYYKQLYIYEIIVLFVEFGYLYWRLKPTIPWKKLAFYVVVANVVSYLLGIIRHY